MVGAIPAPARRTGGHPAKRTFQAIRIWVNRELEGLDRFIGALAAWLLPTHNARTLLIIGAAGTCGMLGDSLAGATLQARRYCDRCRQWTERRVHPCGYRTTHRRGFKWMTNDEVNVIGSLTGAAAAVVLMRVLRG